METNVGWRCPLGSEATERNYDDNRHQSSVWIGVFPSSGTQPQSTARGWPLEVTERGHPCQKHLQPERALEGRLETDSRGWQLHL